MLCLLLPALAAAPIPLREGPDHTIELSTAERSYRYDAHGALVAVGEPWAPAPLSEGVLAAAIGGGNTAFVTADHLVVSGKNACTLPVRGPSLRPRSEAVAQPGVDTPIGAAERPIGLAVDGEHAWLTEPRGVLVVDLLRCQPAGVVSDHAFSDAVGVGVVNGELVSVVAESGFLFRRRSLPDLAELPSIDTVVHAWVDSGGGPRPGPKPRADRAGRPIGDLAINPDPSGPWRLVQEPRGLRVTRDHAAWGAPLPVWTDDARVTADGRVVVTQWRSRLTAWRVADGEPLWVVDVPVPGRVNLGADWVAVGTAGAWMFFDPKDGATLGRVARTGALTIAGEVQPAAAAKLRGAPWSAPTPTAQPWAEAPFPDGRFRTYGSWCTAPRETLAPYAAFPALHNHLREIEARRCEARVSSKREPWPLVASAARGASWTWTAPTRPHIHALAGRQLLVDAGDRVGVLAADGTTSWVVEGNAYAADDGRTLVLGERAGERVIARDAASGATLWERSGRLLALRSDTIVEVVPPGDGRGELLDTRTGEARVLLPSLEGAAWGYACADGECGRTCATCRSAEARAGGVLATARLGKLPAADELVFDGGHRWARTRKTITAYGLSAPAPTPVTTEPATPTLAVAFPDAVPEREGPLGPWLAAADLGTVEGVATEARISGDTVIVVGEGGGVTARRGERVVWCIPEVRFRWVRAEASLVVLRTESWIMGVDPATGALLDVVYAPGGGGRVQ